MKTGKIVIGSVLDCSKKHLEKALKDYDKQLYLKWNPLKANGVGLWEIRRRPQEKTAVPKWEFNDTIIFDLQYLENDIVNHVLDLPALNYACLTRLREMDTWQVHEFANDLEYREEKSRDLEIERNRADLRYAVKQHKRAFRDFQEYVRSGHNPIDLLEGEW